MSNIICGIKFRPALVMFLAYEWNDIKLVAKNDHTVDKSGSLALCLQVPIAVRDGHGAGVRLHFTGSRDGFAFKFLI